MPSGWHECPGAGSSFPCLGVAPSEALEPVPNSPRQALSRGPPLEAQKPGWCPTDNLSLAQNSVMPPAAKLCPSVGVVGHQKTREGPSLSTGLFKSLFMPRKIISK